MDPHTLELLDFPRILDILRSACLSELGRERLESQEIAAGRPEVGERLELAESYSQNIPDQD